MKAFGPYYEQTILVGETAFIKHLLELGAQKGIDWKTPLVHIILGEELVAENARRYLEGLLGTTVGNLQTGLVAASMGIGELGLNLFFEVPPAAPLIKLRRALQDDRKLRELVLGPGYSTVPAFFSYDPGRIYVEFVSGKLVITTLDSSKPIPMVRYNSDDDGGFLKIPDQAWRALEAAGIPRKSLDQVPVVMIKGRGLSVSSGQAKVYPEEIKEGIYHDFALAKLTTANFRMLPGTPARIRIQLAPGVEPSAALTREVLRRHRQLRHLPAGHHVRGVRLIQERHERGLRAQVRLPGSVMVGRDGEGFTGTYEPTAGCSAAWPLPATASNSSAPSDGGWPGAERACKRGARRWRP